MFTWGDDKDALRHSGQEVPATRPVEWARGRAAEECVMGDLLFVAVVVAFFAVTLAYVKGCERIIGPDTPLPDEDVDAARADVVVTTASVGGPADGTTA
jgi:hypothetical protein